MIKTNSEFTIIEHINLTTKNKDKNPLLPLNMWTLFILL